MIESARRGRPPIRGDAKRASFNTRIRTELKAQLEQRATMAGHSLSEEIELRLEASFAAEVDPFVPEPMRRQAMRLLAHYIALGPERAYRILIEDMPDPQTLEPPDEEERKRRVQAILADLQKSRWASPENEEQYQRRQQEIAELNTRRDDTGKEE
jgi:hypothetical protein